MNEERDLTGPDPDQQDPESAPAADEDEGSTGGEDDSTGDEGSTSDEDDDSTGDPELDHQIGDLQDSGERVERHIEETKRDWEAKQQDSRVPGAVPAEGDPEDREDREDREDPEDPEDPPQAVQSEHGQAADEAGQ